MDNIIAHGEGFQDIYNVKFNGKDAKIDRDHRGVTVSVDG
jgi:hypothetical protein